jgi:hypothetical protein
MSTLSTELRNKLERTCIAARNLAERATADALKSLAVAHHEPYGHMTVEQRNLRNKLRAHARQLGDTQDAKGQLAISHLARECAYEHWHRMLFARFLAENNLLIEPEMGVAVSLEECKELAKDSKTNLWALAGRYAQTMLPEVFRADDPLLHVPLAREDQLKLEELLDALATDTFTASDSLGWCYQFWQTERKDQVNAAGNKIGADELPSVTQLFTEDYMVDFLLDNTLGAWHASKVLAANPKLAENAKSEEELRKAVALPGCPWKYLRFIKGKDDKWTPAAGTFGGWPKTAKELRCLDPCMGSGHFVVAMFDRLVALRMAEDKLTEAVAVLVVIRDNLFGLEIDPRCTQIGAFNLALAAWRRVGHRPLPAMNLACSGLAPNTREADWLAMAGDNQKLQRGMERLYRLFQKAAVLGSLINPHAGEGDLLVAAFHELQPLLEKALEAEKATGYLREGVEDTTRLEMAVTARGLTKAAEFLASQFTLLATNVPYLSVSKHEDFLRDYGQRCYPDSRHDLATMFVERCLPLALTNALVTPQNWLFLPRYKKLRQRILKNGSWHLVCKLGPGAFETISGEVVKAALVGISNMLPPTNAMFLGVDVSDKTSPSGKASALIKEPLSLRGQSDQLRNSDARIVMQDFDTEDLLMVYADSRHGLRTADGFRFLRFFWEIPHLEGGWSPEQGTVEKTIDFGGREQVVFWEDGQGSLREFADQGLASLQGGDAWGKQGLTVSLIGNLPVTRYAGDFFDNNCAALWPRDPKDLAAVWTFCSSSEFAEQIRVIDQQLKVTSATLLKIPFNLDLWQQVAAEKYPHGLPKPFSSDPTQWLFNGHPKGSDQPLQVAVARLLGYRWPRQTGSSFPDCPVLGTDGLEKLVDDDGIVCLPSVRGEAPAAERLRQFLAAALGKDWKAQTELELIRASGSEATDLEEWLRNDFFELHCDLFHQRPFIWHIWDGRKRDGFHALVNYHILASGDKGRRTLASLTHSYLGEWITRQKDGIKREEEGADERLAAALALKEILEGILDGEPPYDIFVRWKPLAQQAIGWNPDINDGVRMNIRPFLASDIPGGKKGAGILRAKPNIKWDKDRGKEPHRDKEEYPWFWDGNEFTGDRGNDVHFSKDRKEKARKGGA